MCGRAHMGPTDRKAPFCIAACATTGLNGPLYLNNKKFWTTSLSGHSGAEAKPKAKPAGGTKGTPVPSDDDDDDDDPCQDSPAALEEWRRQRTPFLDSEAEEIGRGGAQSGGARRAFSAADGQSGASTASRW